MSNLPGPSEMAAGGPARRPPRLAHPPQVVPSKSLCQRALSEPRAKTANLPAPVATAAASELADNPESASHAFLLASRCQIWLSIPRTKASRCPAPDVITVGLAASTPPRFSQGPGTPTEVERAQVFPAVDWPP